MKHVLLVDDEEEICDFLKGFLEERNYQVDFVLSAEEALVFLDKKQPDLCVFDIKMPGMNGIELLREVKQKWRDVKVIMLSAVDNEDMLQQAMSLGVEQYLIKPLDLEQLHKTFQEIGA